MDPTSMEATLIPVGILLLVYGAIGVVALRRPLLARLALREAIRRPGQSGLLVLGMMFGAAAILAMQGVFDTFDHTLAGLVYSAWGRTDITESQRGQVFSADVARSLAADLRVAKGAAGVQGGFVLVGSAGDVDQRLSASPVQISTFDGSQPGFGSFTLTNGRTADLSGLSNGDAILNPILASRLDAKPGDHIQVSFVSGDHAFQVPFRVAGMTRAR